MSRVLVRLALVLSLASLIVATGLGAVSGQPAPTAPPAEGPQPLSPVTGICTTNRIKFQTDTSFSGISPVNTWVLIPSTQVNFVAGGATTSCVKIEFSASMYIGSYAWLRATIDGSPAYPFNTYTTASGAWTLQAFNFYGWISPGSHVLRIEVYASSGSAVQNRSVSVHYLGP